MLVSAGSVAKAEAPDLKNISYTYVSLEYEVANTHQGSEGWTLGFCFEVAEPFHVFGGYSFTDIDLGEIAPGIEGDADREGYLIGGGVKHRIAEGVTSQLR